MCGCVCGEALSYASVRGAYVSCVCGRKHEVCVYSVCASCLPGDSAVNGIRVNAVEIIGDNRSDLYLFAFLNLSKQSII